MAFAGSNLRWCATALVVAGTFLAESALAQSSDQPLIFSKPADNTMATPAVGGGPAMSGLAEPRDLSPSVFDPNPGLQLPRPTVNWNKTSNRGNWALMTPEQIMGVQTPEQIFGLPDKNDDKNLSPEERFLQRRENSKLTAATNSLGSAGSLWRDDSNPFNRRDNGSSPFLQPEQRTDSDSPDSARNFSKFFNAPQSSPFDKNQNMNFRATGAFASPTTRSSKANLDQIAEMERFNALLGENPRPDTSPSSFDKNLATKVSSSAPSSLDFDMFGHRLANSANELGQPKSLTPLPELSGSYTPPPATKKAWWQPKPAPWLSSQQNDFSTAPPLRKFY
jgi:hypothetical protein